MADFRNLGRATGAHFTAAEPIAALPSGKQLRDLRICRLI